jgi:predicted dehydrogenase
MSRTAIIGGAMAPALSLAQQSKKYRTVTIGTGWWGKVLNQMAMKSGRVNITGVCDVDPAMSAEAYAEVEKMSGQQPKKYMDYREMLQKEKPEIVIVATPDHWHALNAIAALDAGAHVYLEKPIGHTFYEGRAIVNAARKAGTVCQVDLHRRVTPHGVTGMKFLRDGGAGQIGMIRAFVTINQGRSTPLPDTDPPKGMDWDMWCGPAPYRPFNRGLHDKAWRQHLDYGNGVLADWVHWLDQIMWFQKEQYPKAISSMGGQYIVHDGSDAPDTQSVQWQFDDVTAVWEHHRYAGNLQEKHRIGIYFFGSKGVFHMGWGDGWTFYPSAKGEPTIHEDATLHKPGGQNVPELWANFIECVDTGKKPICDVEWGHRSTAIALLGMVSQKVGRSIAWDGAKEEIIGDPEASKLLRRDYRAPWKYPAA